MTLEVLICTIDDRIAGIALPEARHNVSYLISWQQRKPGKYADIPVALQRPDVKVVTIAGIGSSRNRNNAIDHATGDLCYTMDDDVELLPEHFDDIFSVFEANPSLDLATFKYVSRTESKAYPSCSFNLANSPKGYYVSCIEIVFRRTAVQGRVRFDERFGLGVNVLQGGEDSMFVLDALDAGLTCRFFPIVICRHDALSTGTRDVAKPGVLRAKGAIFYRLYGGGAYPRLLWHAVKERKTIGFLRFLRWTLSGLAFYRKSERAGREKH